MLVELIYDPNRDGAEVRAHKAGCHDIGRDLRYGRHGATSHYQADFASQHQAAEDFYSDFIAEGSMTAEEAHGYVDFLPCTQGLPETAPGEEA